MALRLAPTTAVASEPDSNPASSPAAETPIPIQIVTPKPIEFREFKLAGGPEPQQQIPVSRDPGGAWQVQVRPSSVLQIAGPGITAHSFKLDTPWPTRLHVQPGRSGPYSAGLGLMIGGVLSLTVGLITGILSGVKRDPMPVVDPPGWLSPHSQLAITAGVTLTVGALGLITGGVLYGTSATQVVQTPVPSPPGLATLR